MKALIPGLISFLSVVFCYAQNDAQAYLMPPDSYIMLDNAQIELAETAYSPTEALKENRRIFRVNPIVLSSSLLLISGFCDGTSEVLKIKYTSFEKVFPNANDQFWNYNISWSNKYKKGSPPDARFPGSKTAFVWTTDGYHMMRMIRNCTMIGAVVIPIGKGFHKNWKQYAKEGIIYYVSYTAGFNLAYDVVFK